MGNTGCGLQWQPFYWWYDAGSSFWCIRSSNAQNPAVTPTFDQVTTVNMGGSIVFGGTLIQEGLLGQIFLAVDRSGGPTNNNIYMVASVQPSGRNDDGRDVRAQHRWRT